MIKTLKFVVLAFMYLNFPAMAAKPVLSCLLYTGGHGIQLKQINEGELTAKSNGTTINILSMGNNSFETFQAVLRIPKLSDIRAYGTKVGLAPLGGSVVGYLNTSRNDEINVTCEATR